MQQIILYAKIEKGDDNVEFKRIILKLSGEVLAGKTKHGIDFERTLEIAREVKECVDLGYEIGIVVGG